MSYFNHAFNKTFVGYNGFTEDNRTEQLELGEFGLYDTKKWIATDGVTST